MKAMAASPPRMTRTLSRDMGKSPISNSQFQISNFKGLSTRLKFGFWSWELLRSRLPPLEPIGVADHGHAAEGHRQRGEQRREQNAEERVEHAQSDGQAGTVVDEGADQVLIDVAHGRAAELDGRD